jgi:hypothetical protein
MFSFGNKKIKKEVKEVGKIKNYPVKISAINTTEAKEIIQTAFFA